MQMQAMVINQIGMSSERPAHNVNEPSQTLLYSQHCTGCPRRDMASPGSCVHRDLLTLAAPTQSLTSDLDRCPNVPFAGSPITMETCALTDIDCGRQYLNVYTLFRIKFRNVCAVYHLLSQLRV